MLLVLETNLIESAQRFTFPHLTYQLNTIESLLAAYRFNGAVEFPRVARSVLKMVGFYYLKQWHESDPLGNSYHVLDEAELSDPELTDVPRGLEEYIEAHRSFLLYLNELDMLKKRVRLKVGKEQSISDWLAQQEIYNLNGNPTGTGYPSVPKIQRAHHLLDQFCIPRMDNPYAKYGDKYAWSESLLNRYYGPQSL